MRPTDTLLHPDSEKKEPDQLLNDLKDSNDERKPTPVVSPMKTFTGQNVIQINPVIIPKQRYLKKPYDKSLPDETRQKRGELLTKDQKKANHIASEHKRRANIKIGFENLVDVVPTLKTGHKSEALILQKSIDHLKQLIQSKSLLKKRARELQLMLGEIPDEDSSEGEMDY